MLLEDGDEEVRSAVPEIDAAELAAVEELELELEDAKFALLYMLSRFDPPQYSVEFPSQTSLQPVVAGVLPATSADGGLMVFPQ